MVGHRSPVPSPRIRWAAPRSSWVVGHHCPTAKQALRRQVDRCSACGSPGARSAPQSSQFMSSAMIRQDLGRPRQTWNPLNTASHDDEQNAGQEVSCGSRLDHERCCETVMIDALWVKWRMPPGCEAGHGEQEAYCILRLLVGQCADSRSPLPPRIRITSSRFDTACFSELWGEGTKKVALSN